MCVCVCVSVRNVDMEGFLGRWRVEALVDLMM